MPTADGGLGTALVGEKIVINSRSVAVTKLLGEGKTTLLFGNVASSSIDISFGAALSSGRRIFLRISGERAFRCGRFCSRNR